MLTATAHAELIWTPERGWSLEEGSLSSVLGDEGRSAIDLMNQARQAEEQGNHRSALRTYRRVARNYANSIFAPEANYRSGLIRLQRKQYFKAFDSFQTVLSKYPGTEKFDQIIGLQYRIATALLEGSRNRMFGVIPGFKNREKAAEYFEIVVANAPYSDYAPLALMNIARAHQRRNNEYEAIYALDRMVNAYPQSLLAPDAYIELAKVHAALVEGPYYDQASTKEALTYFEDFLILFPNDSGVVEAERGLSEVKTVLAESKLILADYYFRYRNNLRAARVLYNEAITIYPDSPVADRARSQLNIIDERLERRAAEEEAAEGSGEAPRKRFIFF